MKNIQVCARCETPVLFKDVSEGYVALCPNHEEDLFSFEIKTIGFAVSTIKAVVNIANPPSVTVTVKLTNGNSWEIQTGEKGKHYPHLGHYSLFNGDEDFDAHGNPEFDFAEAKAEEAAACKLKDISCHYV